MLIQVDHLLTESTFGNFPLIGDPLLFPFLEISTE
jgi:hypothetical protein